MSQTSVFKHKCSCLLTLQGLADCYSNEEKIKIENSKELYGVSGMICIAEMQKVCVNV